MNTLYKFTADNIAFEYAWGDDDGQDAALYALRNVCEFSPATPDEEAFHGPISEHLDDLLGRGID